MYQLNSGSGKMNDNENENLLGEASNNWYFGFICH